MSWFAFLRPTTWPITETRFVFALLCSLRGCVLVECTACRARFLFPAGGWTRVRFTQCPRRFLRYAKPTSCMSAGLILIFICSLSLFFSRSLSLLFSVQVVKKAEAIMRQADKDGDQTINFGAARFNISFSLLLLGASVAVI